VHQGKYTKDVLKKFDMGEAKPLLTPMSTTTKLDADEDSEPMDQKEYMSMIGSLHVLNYDEARYTLSSVSLRSFPSIPRTSHR
jgi:hypothetical protein